MIPSGIDYRAPENRKAFSASTLTQHDAANLLRIGSFVDDYALRYEHRYSRAIEYERKIVEGLGIGSSESLQCGKCSGRFGCRVEK